MNSNRKTQIRHRINAALLAAALGLGLGANSARAANTPVLTVDFGSATGETIYPGAIQMTVAPWTGGADRPTGGWNPPLTMNATSGAITVTLTSTSGSTGWRNRGGITAIEKSDLIRDFVYGKELQLSLTGLTPGQEYFIKIYGDDFASNGGINWDWLYSTSGATSGGTLIGRIGSVQSPSLPFPVPQTGTLPAQAGVGMVQTNFTAGSSNVMFYTANSSWSNGSLLSGFELFTVTSSSLPADAGLSTVTATSPVPANGSSTSLVTVTLNDSTGTFVKDKTVTLTSNRNGSGTVDTISAASGPSTTSGVVTFTVTSSTPGTPTFTATDTTDTPNVEITQKPTVIFTGPPTAAQSTVVAAPGSVLANGITASTVTVTLKDLNSQPISGKTVTLARNGNSGAGTPTIATTLGTTNAAGQATFTVKCSTAGDYDFEATDTTDSVTVSQKATVTFTVIPPAATDTSTVTASVSPVIANNSATSTITVTLKDSGGTPVSGKIVTLASDRGSDTISAASGPSSLAGVVTFTVKSTTAGVSTYTATDTTDTVGITQTASVTYTWPALVASAGTPKTVGTGYPATIGGSPTASGGNGVYTYLWDPATGLSDATVANPIASPTSTTTYTVTVSGTDSTGPVQATSSVLVTFTVPNPNLVSVDFKQGSGTTCAGDTTLTGTTMKNAVNNTFTGQLGNWNALNIGTYNNSSATSTFLKTGSSALTTVKLALGLATGLDATAAGGWRCNPNEGATGGADSLRNEEAYLYNNVLTGNHYAWAITGLTPSSTYKLTLFGDLGNATGASNVANTVAGTRDSEGDWNWTALSSDASGTIIGTFTAPNPTLGIYGLQIEGAMPLMPALTANAGADQAYTDTPVTIGGSPTASGGTGSGYTYSWSPSTGLSSATAANPTASPATTTTYTVTVNDGASTPVTDSVTVTVGSALTGYALWASSYAGGETAAASADYNHDGVPNGIAYFMGKDGLATNPGVVNGKVTWPRVGTVTAFEVQISTNLTDWSAAPSGVDLSNPAEVVYTLPASPVELFVRLSVTP